MFKEKYHVTRKRLRSKLRGITNNPERATSVHINELEGGSYDDRWTSSRSDDGRGEFRSRHPGNSFSFGNMDYNDIRIGEKHG